MFIATISINADRAEDIHTVLEKLIEDPRVSELNYATNGRDIVIVTDHAIATLSWSEVIGHEL